MPPLGSPPPNLIRAARCKPPLGAVVAFGAMPTVHTVELLDWMAGGPEPPQVAVARHARAVVLIGRDAGLIRDALTATGVPLLDADTLEAATRLASQQAQPGDAVLLSPACASLDMFRNYGHRAEVFVAAVQALATEAGELL